MEADFSGWATRNGLKCTDGRTIMPDAFKKQHREQVPLMWQHGRNKPEDVLGHAILENRDEGVYAYCFFNNTPAAKHAKEAIQHKDINSLSIWANELYEKGRQVFHGAIREVSLVISGANPGAKIENVTIRHGDGELELKDEEAIITTGFEIEHENMKDDASSTSGDADKGAGDVSKDVSHADNKDNEDNRTVADVLNTLNEEQMAAVEFVLEDAVNKAVKHSDDSDGTDDTGDAGDEGGSDNTDDTDDTGDAGDAGDEGGSEGSGDENTDKDDKTADSGEKGDSEMEHTNIFEKDKGDTVSKHVLSHADKELILEDTKRTGSYKRVMRDYCLEHGITDVDELFPEAKLINNVPEFRKRRTEWVNVVLEGVRKNPFGNIKTISADLTFEDARAKGYVKGSLKKEEFFPVAARTTTPTTIYKKQKLDRDDMIDITDFDVVAWLKGEMRIMLDEEIARAILIGDGRSVDHEDKIKEDHIRPIAKDHELYTTTVNVNIADASSSAQEIIDALVVNRKHLRGSGLPLMFTTETYIAQFMLLKDSTGRRIYKSLDEVAAELRVSMIVPVEAMEEDPTVVAILVNPIDYVLGANEGGKVSMFDDFDIDYNNYKYLIETRVSGALVRVKAAIVVKAVASNVTLITPNAPTFNSGTGVVTIPTQTGVVYKDEDGDTISAGAMTAIGAGETVIIYAVPASSSYAFNNDNDDQWAFTREAS